MPVVREILGQSSWILESDCVSLAVTQLGAHMAPVSFYRAEDPIEPYYISPWQSENIAVPKGVSEKVQRGDFFCMPFGRDRDPNAAVKHPPHGETAVAQWSFVGLASEAGRCSLTIERLLEACPGRVRRTLSLRAGHNAIYAETVIDGYSGPVTFAHHPMLRAPVRERSLLVSTSPIRFGSTYPLPFSNPAAGERQALPVAAEFGSLKELGCESWPARKGCTDLLQLANTAGEDGFAWTAAVNTDEDYAWFALKDPEVLPSLVMWMENGGRPASPYSGRSCVLGLEDACTYFDRGVRESAQENSFSHHGVRTHHELTGEPFTVRHIQGAVRTPRGFGHVLRIARDGEKISLHDDKGAVVSTLVDTDFLWAGKGSPAL